MSKQYGFYYDGSRCIQCRTCELACKSVRNTEPGIRWRRVIDTWGGDYPHVTRTFFSLACMHCEKPACIAVCPTGAISKRVEDGVVVVEKNKCNGCRDCFSACPYGVPQFGADGKMQKCDYCIEIGHTPVCVESCPAEALYSGLLDELLDMGSTKATKKMDGTTRPSLVIVSQTI